MSKAIGIMSKIKLIVPKHTLLKLYYALVLPYLNYCSLVWGGTYPTHLKPLTILQKKIVRIICNVSYFHPTNDLFHENSLLKFEDILKYSLGIYMYKNSSQPVFIRTHSYNTRYRNSLNSAFERLSLTQYSVYFRGPSFWNSLPPDVKEARSLDIFKRKLRNYLLSQYSPQIH